MKTCCRSHLRKRAFTLIELMVVIGIILILAAMLLPSLSRAKDQAHRITCVNNLKQLHLAAQMYVDDNEDQLPPRRETPNHWVTRLREYLGGPAAGAVTLNTNGSGMSGAAARVIQCPKGSSREVTDHSYLVNGFNDYFELTLTKPEFEDIYMKWLWPYGMRFSAVPEASETILFGEKRPSSFHVHMDFSQGYGNDLEEVDDSRHYYGGARSGASNYAFVDGSVRMLRYGTALNPVNLWAIVEQWRQQPLQPLP